MCSNPSLVALIGHFANNWPRKCSQMSRAMETDTPLKDVNAGERKATLAT